MKSKPAKKTAKTAPQNATKKVFDVTRPGKTPVSPTSRPVIVGHKPQVKDPMMSDRDDDRPMLDSSKKVTIQPSADASAALPAIDPASESTGPAAHGDPSSANTADTASTGSLPTASPATVREPARSSEALATQHAESELAGGSTTAGPVSGASTGAEKPAEPTTADSVATIATSSVVDDVPPPQEDTAAPKPVTSPSPTGNTTSGLVFDELDGADPDLTKPVAAKDADSSLPPTDSDSAKLPSASASLEQDGSRTEPQTHEPAVVGQAVVSHHKQSGSAGKVFVALFIVLILAIIAFDILLDTGILNMSNIPHTNFFPSN